MVPGIGAGSLRGLSPFEFIVEYPGLFILSFGRFRGPEKLVVVFSSRLGWCVDVVLGPQKSSCTLFPARSYLVVALSSLIWQSRRKEVVAKTCEF